ncbi:MAG: DUF3035 domain-containing protein [Hyphomonadaceae bacterium]
MSKPIAVVAVLAVAAAASGCSSVSRVMGGARTTPDEFRVMTHAPLTLPPDYNLRPPRPGEARPGESDPASDARTALFGETVGQAATQGERSLVADAGATAADENIRETIDFESQGVVRRNQGFVNRLLAFGGSQAQQSAPLSPEDEANRLADEESIRRTTGGGEVVIRRDRGSFRLPGT